MKELLTLKSKTINLSYVVAAFGAAQMYLPEMKVMLGEYYGLIFMVVGVAYAVLRKVTTKPLSEK